MPATLSSRALHGLHRPKPLRSNNSVRRTYDLLRSSLHGLTPGTRFVEEDLVDALSASRNTVRAVLQQMAREGLVVRVPKLGTRVTGAMALPIDELMTVGEFDEYAPFFREGMITETSVIRAPDIVRQRLELAPDAIVLMIEGLLLQNGKPVALSASYLGLSSAAQAEFPLDSPDPVVFLEQALCVRVGDSSSTIGAVAADEQTAVLLGIEPGSAIVWLEDLINDADGHPRAVSQIRLRGDRVVFTAKTHRHLSTTSKPV